MKKAIFYAAKNHVLQRRRWHIETKFHNILLTRYLLSLINNPALSFRIVQDTETILQKMKSEQYCFMHLLKGYISNIRLNFN